jgi:hypothetical protein
MPALSDDREWRPRGNNMGRGCTALCSFSCNRERKRCCAGRVTCAPDHAWHGGDFERILKPVAGGDTASGPREAHLYFSSASGFDAFLNASGLRPCLTLRGAAVEKAAWLTLTDVGLREYFGKSLVAGSRDRLTGDPAGEPAAAVAEPSKSPATAGGMPESGAGLLLGDLLAHHVHVQRSGLGQDFVQGRGGQ